MIRVTLDPNDQAWAGDVGKMRMAKAKGKPKWAYKDGRSGVSTHIIGAMAELAFCRGLGLVWPASEGVGRREPDVWPRWEVRWAGPPMLKVATNDPPDRYAALVRGKIPNFEIIGYCIAGWAQRTKTLQDPGKRGQPAYFVPIRELVPINPGFHDFHGFMRDDWDMWACAWCGKDLT